MSAYLLGGEVGTNPVVGSVDERGLHEVISYAEHGQGTPDIVLSGVVVVISSPEAPAPSANAEQQQKVSSAVGPLAAAS